MKDAFDSFTKSLRSSKRVILLITIAVVITLIVSSFVSMWLSKVINLSVPSLGNVKTLGVEAYWDQACTNLVSSINWGVLEPGSSVNQTVYIRSISNLESTLYLNSTNWDPINISDYMNLTWNYNGAIIQPGEIIEVTLVLSASSSHSFISYLITNNIKQFSFDIIIWTHEFS